MHLVSAHGHFIENFKNMAYRYWPVIWGFVGMIMFAGCYSFTGASIPSHLKTIGIPLAGDNSGFGRSEIRQSLTDALVEKFTREGSLRVRDRSQADAVLETTISRISDEPVTVIAGDQLVNKRVTMVVEVSYRDVVKSKVMWERSFQQYSDYPIAESLAGFNKALADVLQKISEDILLAAISNW